jgi:hypothetical protein
VAKEKIQRCRKDEAQRLERKEQRLAVLNNDSVNKTIKMLAVFVPASLYITFFFLKKRSNPRLRDTVG